MRAPLLAAILLAALLPTPSASAADPLRVVLDGPAEVVVPQSSPHGRLLFRVTNLGDAPDYVTIPRQGIVWTDTMQTSLGYQSPEFGRPLAPGETGEMWIAFEAQPGGASARTLRVGFHSEATGQTVTAEGRVRVDATPQPRFPFRGDVVDERGAPLDGATITDVPLDLTMPQSQRVPGGRAQLELTQGRHALRADMPGRAGATLVVDAQPGAALTGRFVLPPVAERVAATDVRNLTVNDSVWHAAFSEDLRVGMTAPMTHKDPRSGGAFWGVEDGEAAWSVAFGPVSLAASQVSGFQANDATAAVSRDGSLAAALDWSGVLHVVDVAEGRELWSTDRSGDVNPFYPPGHAWAKGFLTVGATAFSPDGKDLAAGGANGHLAAFDARTGSLRWTRDLWGEIRAMAYSRDGARLYVGAGDWSFHALDPATGGTLWKAPTEFWPFFFVAQDALGTRVGEGGKDGVARVFDAATGEILTSLDLRPGFVTGMGLGEDRLVVSHWSHGVLAYDEAGALLWAREFPTAVVATTADARYALAGWRDFENRGGLVLLDANGTTLWGMTTPAGGAPCASDVSPFPPSQYQTVRVVEERPGVLRIAAACIGGGVVMGTITLEPNPAAAGAPPTTSTTPAPTSSTPPTGPVASSPVASSPVASPSSSPTGATPTPESPATPGLAAPLAILALALLALWRRR